MPDRVRPGGWLRLGIDVAGVLVAFAAAGLLAGWLWEKIWTPNRGVAFQGKWYGGTRANGYTDYTALKGDFDAVAVFALVGLATALVLGVASALLARRAALVTLAAVVVGSILGCFVAYRFGMHLGPSDPAVLAKTAPDRTLLPDHLVLHGKSPFLVWPLGALVGLMTIYFLTTGVEESRRREAQDPAWMGRPPAE